MESRFMENSEALSATGHTTSDLESAGGFMLPSFVTRLENHDNQGNFILWSDYFNNSGDLINGLVWFSGHEHLSDCRSVHCSNGVLNSCQNCPLFRSWVELRTLWSVIQRSELQTGQFCQLFSCQSNSG